eukprot:2697137-Pleurochrysis_carterae.AAC.1
MGYSVEGASSRAMAAAPSAAAAVLPNAPEVKWASTRGHAPGPCTPNCIAWSEHGLIALTCSRTIFLVDAAMPRRIQGILRAERVLEEMPIHESDAISDENGADEDSLTDVWAAACPRSEEQEVFSGVCWSPPVSGSPPQCLLCASIAGTTAVFKKPQVMFDITWEPAKRLDTLLPSRELHSTTQDAVQCSSWCSAQSSDGSHGVGHAQTAPGSAGLSVAADACGARLSYLAVGK